LGNDRRGRKLVKHVPHNAATPLIHYIYNFRHRIFIKTTMITWQHPGRPIILASQSPRRKEILAQMGLTFTSMAPAVLDETAFIDAGRLSASLRNLAKAKVLSVAERRAEALVLGADTVVVQGKRILGKPADRGEARSMLSALVNARHRVYTGVALVCKACSFSATACACTDVFFRKVTVDEIEAYLKLDEYRDKAGAYAIQGHAMLFVEKIKGCYYNVVGLPVARTISLFKSYIRSLG
jgi:septum formation protein